MPGLADLIAAHQEFWQTTSVEEGVFLTADPAAIAGHVEGFCSDQFHAGMRTGLFYGASSGCVAGLELSDGHRIVVKAYQDRWGAAFLGAVRRTQEHLSARSFPCPRPLVDPAPAGPALATAEELVPDPGMRTFASPEDMAASAAGLAQLVDMCRGLDAGPLLAHPLRQDSGRLYPQPHNPLFDFSLDPDGAEWIDQLAERAKVARAADDSDPVVAHTDWSARNIRLDGKGLLVAYDWDSLALVPESVAVGQAAATWRSTGEADDPLAPGPDEVRRYIRTYEEASGRHFQDAQVRAAMAAALWVLAYTARCEHAVEAATGKRVERGRGRLAREGTAYLQSWRRA